MLETHNQIDASTRSTMVDTLNSALADAIHLSLQLKQAHWNVRGPHFLPLHELFDKVTDHAREWADLLAERAGALGGLVDGTLEGVSERTTLDAYPSDLTDGEGHVERVAAALGAFGSVARSGIEAAADAGDAATEDLFTEIAREADLDLWFVEAHLQG